LLTIKHYWISGKILLFHLGSCLCGDAYFGQRKGWYKMVKKSRSKEIIINGYIEADQWDEDDNVIGVKVVTDYEDYSIEMNSLGEELLSFLGEDVDVTGIVEEEKDGSKVITVTGFEILAESDEDDDFDLDFEDDFDFDGMMIDNMEDDFLH
jgi:hypothetical protein